MTVSERTDLVIQAINKAIIQSEFVWQYPSDKFGICLDDLASTDEELKNRAIGIIAGLKLSGAKNIKVGKLNGHDGIILFEIERA